MSRLLGIIIGLLILSLMLVIHEAGHFFVGRKLGLTVVEFSVFMGPRLLTWVRKGVRYSIRAIPLGASVEFLGEYDDSENSDDEYNAEYKKLIEEHNYDPDTAFNKQAVWKRILTLLAGPFSNLLTAALAFIILFSLTGFNTTAIAQLDPQGSAYNSGISSGEKITSIADYKVRTDLDITIAGQVKNLNEEFIIETVGSSGNENTYTITPSTRTDYILGVTLNNTENRPSIHSTSTDINPDAGQFVIGDQILAINDDAVDIDNVSSVLEAHKGPEPIQITVLRGDAEITLDYNLAPTEIAVPLGIELQANDSFMNTLPYSFQYQWSYLRATGSIIGQIFTGEVNASETLSGPIGIIDTLGTVASGGTMPLSLRLINMLSMFAVISLALGMANLLPIAPMDGGQLLLVSIEGIRGKPLSTKVQNIIYLVGIVIILAIFVMAFVFDIGRIIG